jgi:hypothetical protein
MRAIIISDPDSRQLPIKESRSTFVSISSFVNFFPVFIFVH